MNGTGLNIKRKVDGALKMRGKTMHDLREFLNEGGVSCTLTTLYNWVNGDNQPSQPDAFEKIAQFLEVSYNALMDPDIDFLAIAGYDSSKPNEAVLARIYMDVLEDPERAQDEKRAARRALEQIVDKR